MIPIIPPEDYAGLVIGTGLAMFFIIGTASAAITSIIRKKK